MSICSLRFVNLKTLSKTNMFRHWVTYFGIDNISISTSSLVKNKQFHDSQFQAVPTGKWKHDKFASIESLRPQAAPSSGINSFVSANKKVRLNISNLAPTVTTADLKVFISDY